MNTLLWLWSFLPVFLFFLTICAVLTIEVRDFLAEYDATHLLTVERQRLHSGGFALAMAWLWITPRPTGGGLVAFDPLITVVMILFLFRPALTDAVSGWLPLRFTLSCLIAGLMVSAVDDALSDHLVITGGIGFVGAVFRFVGFRIAGREVLGLGDVWLAAALAAWLGRDVLDVLLLALTGFLVWHGSGAVLYRKCTGSEGPLGPWLCYSVLVMLILGRHS